MASIYYPRDYFNNLDPLHRIISDAAVQLLADMKLFHTITVNEFSVIGIYFCFDHHHNQLEFNLKLGVDKNNPYIAQLVWYKNNREAPIDEVLSLLAPYESKNFILYNLDLFSRRKIDVREIRRNND